MMWTKVFTRPMKNAAQGGTCTTGMSDVLSLREGSSLTAVGLTLSSGYILDPRPPVEDHGAVMVNVQEGHLIVFLPQDEEQLQERSRLIRFEGHEEQKKTSTCYRL